MAHDMTEPSMVGSGCWIMALLQMINLCWELWEIQIMDVPYQISNHSFSQRDEVSIEG